MSAALTCLSEFMEAEMEMTGDDLKLAGWRMVPTINSLETKNKNEQTNKQKTHRSDFIARKRLV